MEECEQPARQQHDGWVGGNSFKVFSKPGRTAHIPVPAKHVWFWSGLAANMRKAKVPGK
jgi:hypothetical protein